jgi:LysM repeat protein
MHYENSGLITDPLIDTNSDSIAASAAASGAPPLKSDFSNSISPKRTDMTSRLNSKERKSPVSDSYQQQGKFVYIDFALNGQDSLHSLSMKFSVNVSELKRINCLTNDRDIFALKTLKIPIKPFSLLSQQYSDQLKYTDSNLTRLNTNTLDFDYETRATSPNESENEFSDTGNNRVSLRSKDDDHVNTYLVGKSQNGQLLAETEFFKAIDDESPLLQENGLNDIDLNHKANRYKQSKEARRYFKKMDNNLETLRHQNSELTTNVTKNEQLIPISDMSYSVESSGMGKISNLNLNVRDLLIFACLIVVIFPLVFYIYEFYK